MPADSIGAAPLLELMGAHSEDLSSWRKQPEAKPLLLGFMSANGPSVHAEVNLDRPGSGSGVPGVTTTRLRGREPPNQASSQQPAGLSSALREVIYQTPPSTAADCPRAHCYPDPVLGGHSPGDHLLTHQEHAQIL
ncbi:unnamed protein product [Pleuronectes platessa]|uniref:Uncharacterized protein n=1 Tax=Pleuronectes platessa TaxID=8262 RepID=A0A9N7VWB3_PLEPL|nr:unnamed protein product [Pleuronectes platessa]